ncbi:hypothetical protein IMSAG249_02188 [Lachnospiraceae bacterium]|nr:hypothetical protein IMSAGC009_01212 [Lachnospiraceae bacterium]GFI70359.1 hypothetical protein IMSAG249_02188 [Lachnospiraceae bacterium]
MQGAGGQRQRERLKKMLEGVEKIFEEMQPMMKKLKKSSYEKNMFDFREKHSHYFREMADYMDQAQDKEKAAGEMAASFVDKVEKHYTQKGKIGGRVQADLNFFMIYYTFPAILLTGSEHAKVIADTICREWGARFKDSKIGYTDYYTLYDGFRDKIFGIF